MRKPIWAMALALMSFIATRLLSSQQYLVERYYSGLIYPPVARLLSRTLGRFSFSVAGILLMLFLAYPVLFLLHRPSRKRIGRLLAAYLTMAGLLYFAFVALWGLNYLRMPLAEIMGLEIRPSSADELRQVAEYLIEQANELRLQVLENSDGVMMLDDSRRSSLMRVQQGYDAAKALVPELAGSYSTPKGPAISTVLSYLGIAGIYSPFTGEAHVNIRMPDSSIPATAVHEAAHQRGFSREDEANFIAYLVCSLHPDADFRYSGTLLALNHTMNALFRADRTAFHATVALYSEALRRDLSYVRDFWQRYEGPAERAADRVNDAYLRANQQQDGVASYGRMVDLLLAYARAKGIVSPEEDAERDPDEALVFRSEELSTRHRLEIVDGLDRQELAFGETRAWAGRPVAGLVRYTGVVEHIFVHPLIPYPEVTFSHRQSGGFDDWFITATEFRRLLGELYAESFILVTHDDVYEEYTVAGTRLMRRRELWLPAGKKPLILSIDDMNYYTYMREAGLPDRLILDAEGNVAVLGRRPDGSHYVSRTACVVPLLDDFVSRFPDFSYRGAKGVIALTGYEGILGYRTQVTYPAHPAEREAVRPVVSRLMDSGWKFASHSWGHRDFAAMNYASFVTDAGRWQAEVGSLVGPVNIMIYPFGASVPHDSAKFTYLWNQGFRIFCAVGPNSFEQISRTRAAVMTDRRAIDGLTLRQKRHDDVFSSQNVLMPEVRPVR